MACTREGTIAPGSDADIVVFDPEKRHLITAATQHSKTDYNLYEGTESPARPRLCYSRGNVLVDSGELVAEPEASTSSSSARLSGRSSCPLRRADENEARRRANCSPLPGARARSS